MGQQRQQPNGIFVGRALRVGANTPGAAPPQGMPLSIPLVPARDELDNLRRRLRLIYFAVASAVFCALFVGLLIIVAFIDAFMSVNLATVVGALFIMAMAAFIGSLVVFLREIFLAVANTRKSMPKT